MKNHHYSVSQIENYCHCGEKWRLRYLENIPEPSTSHQIRGTAVDRSVSQNMTHKRDHGVVLALDEAEQIAADAADNAFRASAVALSEDEAEAGLEVTKGNVIDASVALARRHHQEVAPRIDPVTIQEKITVSMPGRPDIIAVLDLTDKQKRVRDTKTTARKPNQDAVDRSLQLSQYHLSYQAHYGEPPSALVHDTLVIHKPTEKSPIIKTEYHLIETHRTEAELQAYLDRVDAVDAAIQKGVAVPADVNSWKCAPQFCGYYGTICRYTRK